MTKPIRKNPKKDIKNAVKKNGKDDKDKTIRDKNSFGQSRPKKKPRP